MRLLNVVHQQLGVHLWHHVVAGVLELVANHYLLYEVKQPVKGELVV